MRKTYDYIFLFLLSDFMAARDLITAMISNNHMFRPSALEVIYHCLFWPPDKQLAFFQVCCALIRVVFYLDHVHM